MNWIPLTESKQLDAILHASDNKRVLIFKHSTRCGISRKILSRFEELMASQTENISFYYLDLLKCRPVSNEIAVKLKVEHQSPQLLLIKNGELIAHHSHYAIISEFNFEKN